MAVKRIIKLIERSCQNGRMSFRDSFIGWINAVFDAVKNGCGRISLSGESHKTYQEAFEILLENGRKQPFLDILGEIYMRSGCVGKGQHFTPSNVALLMASMNLAGIDLTKEPSDKLITVCDPACGSGVTLLAACKVVNMQYGCHELERFHFTANDIDPVCSKMTAIQLAVNRVPNFLVTRGNGLADATSLELLLAKGRQRDWAISPAVNYLALTDEASWFNEGH